MPNFRGIQRFMVTLGTPRSPSMFLSCGQRVGTEPRRAYKGRSDRSLLDLSATVRAVASVLGGDSSKDRIGQDEKR